MLTLPRSTSITIAAFCLLAICGLTAVPAFSDTAPALSPVDISQFFVAPGALATIQWNASGIPAGTPLSYAITNYEGATVASDGFLTPPSGPIAITIKLPAGYYQITFLKTNQSFGIVSIPPHSGKADPFFCLDTAMSWLELRRSLREPLVSILQRTGVSMVRERFSWKDVMPTSDTFDLQTPRGYDDLRQIYVRHGIQILDLLSDAPKWTEPEPPNPYPGNLPVVSAAVQRLAEKWNPYWNALEVWNEPNQGAVVPADQYVPTVKAIDWALASRRLSTTMGVGTFGEFNRDFVAQAIDNGMLEGAGFLSFHDYSEVTFLQNEISAYRLLMKHGGDETLPLWITECGWPWTSGPARPPADQDRQSALQIAMKSVEARACGIARFFPFVYTSYVEPGRNFGMMGREATPLAAMAAYAQAIRTLSGKAYAGDLRCCDPLIKRARVFSGGAETIVILYGGALSTDAAANIGVRTNRIEGIDGRVLAARADGSVSMQDGMAYAWVDVNQAKKLLITDTVAARLAAAAVRASSARKNAPSPLVLQYLIDRSVVTPSATGYDIAASAVQRVPLTVRLSNLSSTDNRAALKLTCEGASDASKTIDVPAESTATASWVIDLTSCFTKLDTVAVRISGHGTHGPAVVPLVVTFRRQRELSDYLRNYPASQRIDVTDLSRWDRNISGNGNMEISILPDAHLMIDAHFTAGASWFFPHYTFAPASPLGKATGLLIRARQDGKGRAHLLLDKGNGSIYVLLDIVPPDGEWHTRYLRFEDATPLVGHPSDPDGQLRSQQITQIQLGCSNPVGRVTMEVSDVYAVLPTSP